MTEENNQDISKVDKVDTSTDTNISKTDQVDKADIKAESKADDSAVKSKIEEIQAEFKSKADALDKKLRKFEFENETLTKAKQELENQLLEKDGKPEEAEKKRSAELADQLKALKEENTKLSRDHAIDQAFLHTDVKFLNSRTADIAKLDVANQLKKSKDSNEWLNADGKDINFVVDEYIKSETNAFLFAGKENVGANKSNLTNTANSGGLSSINGTGKAGPPPVDENAQWI